MSLPVGTRLKDRYEVIECIGSGSMGAVYRAVDTRLHRPVALKTLKIAGTDERVLERFRREAVAASKLAHPAIVQVYEIDEDMGPFIVMELIEGRSLKDMLEEGPLGVAEAVRIARQVADALAEAHGKQIVHRDLKPANILLDPRGRARICDFGLAKLTDWPSITGAAFIGTALYAAPETVMGGRIDGRADVFSLGVVLYEMLTGLCPFHGDSVPAILHSVLNQQPDPPGELAWKEIPEELDAVVMRALEKSVKKRYQNMGQLDEVLARVEEQLTGGEAATGPASRSRGRQGSHDSSTLILGASGPSGPRLVRIARGGRSGEAFSLFGGTNVIGRTTGDLVFRDDPLLSAVHASITIEETGGALGERQPRYVLRDENSSNGVYLRLRDEWPLESGDEFTVGTQLFVYRGPSDPATGEARRGTGQVDGRRPTVAGEEPTVAGEEATVAGEEPTGDGEAGPPVLVRVHSGQEVERLELGDEAVIGREVGDIQVPGDPFVSRRHARVVRNDRSFRLSDTGSVNGTYIRVRREARLLPGDHVRLGGQVFRFEV